MADRRRSLPLALELLERAGGKLPSIDAARKRLGGRGVSDAGAGRVVRVDGTLGEELGVVLFVAGERVDVFTERGYVRRLEAARAPAHGGAVDPTMQRIADDVRVFDRLREGERVRYERRGGEMSAGTLLEKCRYGALVLAEDGKIVAVGFRKLWPLPHDAPS